jgi:LacI family transcriptional regulator
LTRLRKVTLSEVATRAGVSPTTASYILNGMSAQMRISAETEQRVRGVVAELGYRPNRNARSLRTAKTTTIGVITDFVASGTFSSEMLAGANVAARQADHLLVIGESEGDQNARDLLVDEMTDRQVDGIIYATRTTLKIELPPRLRGLQVVLLNCFDPGSDVPSILPDDRSGGRAAAEVLLGAGIVTDVRVVGEAPENDGVAGPLRLAGIQERFAEDGHEIAGTLECEWSPEAAYQAVSQHLQQGHRPSGLICMNDRTALGTYQALADHGLTVPGDVSVVSFDGSMLASWLRPRVTSVALPFRDMGALAVERVLDPEAQDAGPHRVPMPVQWGASVPREGRHSDA